MKLVKAQILGFRSFSDSGEIEFSDGINLIVGQNNAGKSALLRALLQPLTNDRHRTPERWEDFRLPSPEVRLSVEVSGQEMSVAMLQRDVSYIPAPPNTDTVQFGRRFLEIPQLIIAATNGPHSSIFTTLYPGHGLFQLPPNNHVCVSFTPLEGELAEHQQFRGDDSIGALLTDVWKARMFYFTAERMTIGECSHGHAPRLSPNANNLPSVLHTLIGDRGDRFRKLIEHVREIFSTVGNLSVRPKPDNANLIEVRVWPTEAMERVELSFPLDHSGTGVSQVLALLTAIMTVENAVVVVDEINSFLHPSAVKALLRILQTDYPQHQYIISTHAPEVIGFSNPQTLHLVRRSGYESTVSRLNLQEVEQFREVAEHLGVAMADVFAADRIIWVEGPTEELCFPLLYQHVVGHALPKGTVITSVASTGDFAAKRRDRTLVYEIYRRLSTAATPLVVSVAFSFDSEQLTQGEKEQMHRESQEQMYFLPRRHFECYLIDPAAIAAFICEKDPASENVVTERVVEEKLIELAGQRELLVREWQRDISDEAWQARVDAARLISQVCVDLSEARVTFNKKNESLYLLQHVLRHRPETIRPLCDYVCNLVDSVQN